MIIAAAGAALWRRANRLYATMQAGLRDTLKRSAAQPETGATIVSYLMEEGEGVRVTTFALSARSQGLGRSLAEMNIRGITGASILQVNRQGTVLVAPSAALRFEAGDEVLVVGSEEQVAAARGLILG